MSKMTDKQIAALMQRFPVQVLSNGNIRTCPVRLSYPHLFEKYVNKKKFPDAEPKFSVTCLFPKGADLSAIEKATRECAVENFGRDWERKKVELPLLDQGKEGTPEGGYVPGAMLCRSTSSQKPKVVNRSLADVDKDDVYPGIWAIVTLRPFPSDYGKKRVSLGLQNVMIIADDERLGGGGSRAEDDFEPIDALDELEGETEFG